MTSGALLTDLLSSITERGRVLLGRNFSPDPGQEAASLVELCETLLSRRGEASGIAIAAEILERYGDLDAEGRLALFRAFAERFGADLAKLAPILAGLRGDPSDHLIADLHQNSEPRRLELFRRLNRAPGGTKALVAMRADLLDLTGTQSDLAVVDRDFSHLLSSWFNRGFLVLRRIDWSTAAIILEKIIRYEAVHEISDFDALRHRIDPPDRRCYGFFHPALADEPLIFVEVALTETAPAAIAPLLAEDRAITPLARARTAVFYSISNCQRGLAGISFGNFLIKQVVEDLRREFPKLDHFVTLSPVPGFVSWLRRTTDVTLDEDARAMLAHLDDPIWAEDPAKAESLRRVVEPLAARYFLKAKRADGRPVDPVARFHLGNGAQLDRICWGGDHSFKGWREGASLMVNYLYDLDRIEENHETYANQNEVVASSAVRKMVKSEPRPRAPTNPG